VKSGFELLVQQLIKHWFLFIPLVVIVIAVILEIIILKRYLNRKYGLRKCRIFYSAAQANFPANPALCVRMCYSMTRSLLNLGGFPRIRNAELLEYGRSLSVIDFDLYKDVVVIFYMFSKLEYSLSPITLEEAGEVLERLERVREYIYVQINETPELITDNNK